MPSTLRLAPWLYVVTLFLSALLLFAVQPMFSALDEVVRPEVCLLASRRTDMPRKRHKPEEIVTKLRQVDVLVSQGQGIADAIRQIGVSEVTYYRWRQEFGGLKTEQVKRLKDLETENARLRRAVSDLTLDKLILQEASRGNY
jgi:transposase-like protein